jgi:hypothetical protein
VRGKVRDEEGKDRIMENRIMGMRFKRSRRRKGITAEYTEYAEGIKN